jgi:hypothetical protein
MEKMLFLIINSYKIPEPFIFIRATTIIKFLIIFKALIESKFAIAKFVIIVKTIAKS